MRQPTGSHRGWDLTCSELPNACACVPIVYRHDAPAVAFREHGRTQSMKKDTLHSWMGDLAPRQDTGWWQGQLPSVWGPGIVPEYSWCTHHSTHAAHLLCCCTDISTRKRFLYWHPAPEKTSGVQGSHVPNVPLLAQNRCYCYKCKHIPDKPA